MPRLAFKQLTPYEHEIKRTLQKLRKEKHQNQEQIPME